MTISEIANLMTIPIGIVCLFISLRAFYIYNLSRSDMVYVLGLSMACIAGGTFLGTVGDAHIAGNTLNTDWGRAYGACCGGLFIFLSSLASSHKQMQQLKRWQVLAVIVFVIVVLLTPLYPPAKSPPIAFALNACRMVIYTCAFMRYFTLYLSKGTRFSLIMWSAFLILLIGYALNIPGILQGGLALVTIIAATVRITAYLTILAAYSIG
jgi:hypothetical protein